MKNYKKNVKDMIISENKILCVDCGTPNPQWASVTFGIFICLECAGTHRSYGASVSRVKSINMDDWNEREYLAMKVGGNKEFESFIKKNNVDKKESFLYNSDIAYSYTKDLTQKVNDIIGEEQHNISNYIENRCSKEDTKNNHNSKKLEYNGIKSTENQAIHAFEPTLQQALNATISLIGDSVLKSAKIIKDKSVEYGLKISEKVVKPSIQMLKEKKEVISNKIVQNKTKIADSTNNVDKSNREDEPGWNKWD